MVSAPLDKGGLGGISKRRVVSGGCVVALFLILTGLVRFGMEYLREQHYELLFGLTRGQILAVIVFLLGVGVWLYLLNDQLRLFIWRRLKKGQ